MANAADQAKHVKEFMKWKLNDNKTKNAMIEYLSNSVVNGLDPFTTA